ncbi:MAG: hypothetical protein ACQESQ_08730, partial [Bacteroidota bacterium]
KNKKVMNANYSLAIVGSKADDQQIKNWKSFEKEMKKEQIEEAIIIPIAPDAEEVNLAKRYIFGLLMEKDNVNYAPDYCLIDHENNDKLLPSIVLFDPDLQQAAMTALQYNPGKYFIQAVITQTDNQLHVNKCPLTEFDDQFNDSVN